jgi:hypothetical protein
MGGREVGERGEGIRREERENGGRGNEERRRRDGGMIEESGRIYLYTPRPFHQLVYPPHHSILRESHHLVQEILFLPFEELPYGREGEERRGEDLRKWRMECRWWEREKEGKETWWWRNYNKCGWEGDDERKMMICTVQSTVQQCAGTVQCSTCCLLVAVGPPRSCLRTLYRPEGERRKERRREKRGRQMRRRRRGGERDTGERGGDNRGWSETARQLRWSRCN